MVCRSVELEQQKPPENFEEREFDIESLYIWAGVTGRAKQRKKGTGEHTNPGATQRLEVAGVTG